MRITKTGANGFIGSHLTEELSKRVHLVRAVCQPGTDAGIVDGVADEIQWADMRDGARLSSLVRGSDAVVHLAARIADYGTLDRFQQINIEGTRNLVDASIRVGARLRILTGKSPAPAKSTSIQKTKQVQRNFVFRSKYDVVFDEKTGIQIVSYLLQRFAFSADFEIEATYLEIANSIVENSFTSVLNHVDEEDFPNRPEMKFEACFFNN